MKQGRIFITTLCCLGLMLVFASGARAALSASETHMLRASIGYTASLATWLQKNRQQLRSQSANKGQAALAQCSPLLERGLVGPWSTADMDDIYHNLLASGASQHAAVRLQTWINQLQSVWHQAAIHPWWASTWLKNLQRIQQMLYMQQARITSPQQVCSLAADWDAVGWSYSTLPAAVSQWQALDSQTYRMPALSSKDSRLIKRLVSLARGKTSTGIYLWADLWLGTIKQEVGAAALADPLLQWAYANA